MKKAKRNNTTSVTEVLIIVSRANPEKIITHTIDTTELAEAEVDPRDKVSERVTGEMMLWSTRRREKPPQKPLLDKNKSKNKLLRRLKLRLKLNNNQLRKRGKRNMKEEEMKVKLRKLLKKKKFKVLLMKNSWLKRNKNKPT